MASKHGVILLLLISGLVSTCTAAPDAIQKCKKFDGWQNCMSGLLDEYYARCKGCNIIIYKFRDTYINKPGFTPPSSWELSTNTQWSPTFIFNEDIFVNVDQSYFHVVAFHGAAYFETTGWYGWSNWAFAGKFKHAYATPSVQFFQN